MAITRLEPLLSHKVFRAASGVNALVALALGVLGTMLHTMTDLRGTHAVLAIVFLLTSLTAALSGMRYAKESHTSGITGHGFGMLVIALVQYGLGEAALTMVHMVLGLVIVLGAGFLFYRALQQPIVVTGGDFPAGEPRP